LSSKAALQGPLIQKGNHEEVVQQTKGQRRHGEEVHRGDGFTMIATGTNHAGQTNRGRLDIATAAAE
jgi:hypothetical protein